MKHWITKSDFQIKFQSLQLRKSDAKDQQRILSSFDLVGRAVDRMALDVDYFLVGRLKTSHVGGFSNGRHRRLA